MVESIELQVWGAPALRARASWRYGLLHRVARCAERNGVVLLAFGLGDGAIRLVVDGPTGRVGNVIRGIKVGTLREAAASGERILFVETVRQRVGADLTGAVVWAHAVPSAEAAGGPLASPWTSHRDLLGFRRAAFYRPEVLFDRVVPADVHRALGGAPLPEGWPPRQGRPSLALLLQVAAAVRGTLPADPACFATFVQLARVRGWPIPEIAAALQVTPRRVRQLAQADATLVGLAARALDDPRLARLP
jgi:hypothetical protein